MLYASRGGKEVRDAMKQYSLVENCLNKNITRLKQSYAAGKLFRSLLFSIKLNVTVVGATSNTINLRKQSKRFRSFICTTVKRSD